MSYVPDFLKPKIENIPEDLKQQPWAVWIAEPRPSKPGKFNKAPRSPRTGQKIGANKPELFGTFDEAATAFEANSRYTGIGVLLTGNGIVGFDLDDCKDLFGLQPEVQQWVALALAKGAYCEWSPSGTGLRLFMRGYLPGTGRKRGELEIYDRDRFLTITGHVITEEDLPWAS